MSKKGIPRWVTTISIYVYGNHEKKNIFFCSSVEEFQGLLRYELFFPHVRLVGFFFLVDVKQPGTLETVTVGKFVCSVGMLKENPVSEEEKNNK